MSHVPETKRKQSNDLRTPVTLLTGFLGAGKTTLLNRILKEPSSGSIAVIVNEFGEAGLDHDLIETVDTDVTLMASGCLCCSIRGDLPETFQRLFEQRSEGLLQFDRVHPLSVRGVLGPEPIEHAALFTLCQSVVGPWRKLLLISPSQLDKSCNVRPYIRREHLEHHRLRFGH